MRTETHPATQPLLSIVVPVHQGAELLPRSLAAIARSDLPRESWELIVVDDASSDGSASVAGQYADIVIRLPGRSRGPAYARNRGFEVARGDIIVFADADVCVHDDTLSRILQHFEADPTLAAVVGAYDTATPGRGIVTQYRNLRHCYLRRRGAGEIDTFWSACGAIRRSVFAEVGQYDEWHYWRPQAEGSELGRRLRLAGHRILLDPRVAVTHLKEWSLVGMYAGDLLDVGVPWMRLLLQQKSFGTTRAPSISTAEKVNTVLTWLGVWTAAAYAVWREPALGFVAAAALVIVGIATVPALSFFARQRGILFALATLPLHFVHYLVTGASVVCAWLLHQLVGEPMRDASDAALAEVGLKTWPPVPRRSSANAWQHTG